MRSRYVILIILFFAILGFTGCGKKESGEGESRQLITEDTESQGEDKRITKENEEESKDSRIDDVSNKELTAEDTGSQEEYRGIVKRNIKDLKSTEMGNFHLLSIGINDYIFWPKLRTAVNDAKEIVKVLKEQYCFSPEQITELYDAQTTEENIIAALRKLARQINEDDSLLIFYAGHGHLDDITKSGFWVPVNGARDNSATWIDNGIIKTYLNINAMKAKHILLISDSCFAGDFFSDQRGAIPKITDAYIRTAFQKTSRQAITSGGVEPVQDAGFGGHSVFSYFLLKALKENQYPYLLPSAIYERIKGGVSANASQQAQLGILSGTGGEIGGGFVLFKKGAAGSLDDLVSARKEQLSFLEEAEAEMKAKSEAEAAEIKVREEKISEMDKKISVLQKKLAAAGHGDSSTLKQIVAVVRQREKQAKELDELRRKAEEERRKREQELVRLKEEERQKRYDALMKDIKDYQYVAGSKYGKDLTLKAWEGILEKWGLARGSIRTGDITGLCAKLALWAPVSAGFVLVEGGTFRMGSDKSDDEKPVHEVKVDSFYIGKYEVTFEEYDLYCQAAGKSKPGDEGWGRGGRPVKDVSWYDAVAYCNWLSKKEGFIPCYAVGDSDYDELIQVYGPKHPKLKKAIEARMNITCDFSANGYRLPTEAEWEYAARGGSKSSGYTYSGSNDPGEVAWYSQNSGSKTHPAGEKKASELGIHDMSGNVWEWCWDWYDGSYYSKSVKHNPKGPSSGQARVLRGSSWGGHASDVRTAGRSSLDPAGRHYYSYGFRLVRTFTL